jgi:hypothetical protein
MRRSFLVIAAVLSFCSAIATAQAKPDFSGKWVLDPTAAPAPAGVGDGSGRGPAAVVSEFTAKQDARTLTITRMQGDQTLTETFNLDGSETRDTLQTPGGPRERVFRATWDGNRLVINGTLNFDGKMLQQNRVMSMEGGNLVIEQTAPGPAGPTMVKRVYKKG